MFYVESLGEYINSMEDLEFLSYTGKIDKDIIEGIRETYNKELQELQEINEIVRYKKEQYEMRLERSKCIANDSRLSIEDLIEYVEGAKRIDRNKILKILKSLYNDTEQITDC